MLQSNSSWTPFLTNNLCALWMPAKVWTCASGLSVVFGRYGWMLFLRLFFPAIRHILSYLRWQTSEMRTLVLTSRCLYCMSKQGMRICTGFQRMQHSHLWEPHHPLIIFANCQNRTILKCLFLCLLDCTPCSLSAGAARFIVTKTCMHGCHFDVL